MDADTVSDTTAFLETFFKLYPTATEKELAYYVGENVMEPVQREYQSERIREIFRQPDKSRTDSQYELILHKDSNWKIVG